MRRSFVVFLLTFYVFTAKAQQADQRIGELLTSSDWFALDREYPALKDSAQVGYLRQMSEVMLAWSFNRPAEAVVSIDTLLTKTTLSDDFYEKNKAKVDSVGVKVTRLSGGVGNFRTKDFLAVPCLSLNVGGTDVTLDNVLVTQDGGNFNVSFDGNIGLELIERCRKATLNVRDMFLKIEY